MSLLGHNNESGQCEGIQRLVWVYKHQNRFEHYSKTKCGGRIVQNVAMSYHLFVIANTDNACKEKRMFPTQIHEWQVYPVMPLQLIYPWVVDNVRRVKWGHKTQWLWSTRAGHDLDYIFLNILENVEGKVNFTYHWCNVCGEYYLWYYKPYKLSWTHNGSYNSQLMPQIIPDISDSFLLGDIAVTQLLIRLVLIPLCNQTDA
jgi:hypothetical protein